MKCIKAIRSGKNHETGDIKRIEDVDAESRVRGGSWVYVPKNEWKKTRKPIVVESPTVNQPKTKKEVKTKK